MWGKVKTALQMLTICFYYFGYAAEAAFSAHPERSVFATQVISYVLCWVVAAVTLISGVKYLGTTGISSIRQNNNARRDAVRAEQER